MFLAGRLHVVQSTTCKQAQKQSNNQMGARTYCLEAGQGTAVMQLQSVNCTMLYGELERASTQ